MSLIQSPTNLHLSFIYSPFLYTRVRSDCFSAYCLDMKAETAAFSSLYSHGSRIPMAPVFPPWVPYSHGSGQSHAWRTKSKCRHFPSPRVPNWIFPNVTEWWGCLAGILIVHWTCTFWKAFNLYLSRVFPRDSSFAPELAPLSKKHSSVPVLN